MAKKTQIPIEKIELGVDFVIVDDDESLLEQIYRREYKNIYGS